jgi:glycosyltransferase involved in cell wall biosynthesis
LPHQARPVYESGYYGLPIVISDFPHTAEFVRHGFNGLTFEPGNFSQLASTLDVMRKHKDLVRRLGEENRRQFDEKREFSLMAKRLTELVRSELVKGAKL